MKSFLEYLCEASNDPNMVKLREVAAKSGFMPRGKTPKNPSIEICSGKFGSTEDEIRKTAKEVFKDIDVTFGKGYPPKTTIPAIKKDLSGQYYALEVMYNGKTYYITSTNVVTKSGGQKTVIDKALTPSKLNITRNIYNSVDKLYNDIVSNIKSFNIEQHIKDWALNICKVLVDINNYEFNGCYNKKTANEYALYIPNMAEAHGHENPPDGICTIKIPPEISQKLNGIGLGTTDKKIILKDFGETLGPIMYLNLFKECDISFPVNENEKLVDYYLNKTIRISAKSGNGAAASGKEPFIALPDIIKNNPTLFSSKELDFVNKIIKSYSFGKGLIFSQQKYLGTEFILNKKPELHKFLNDTIDFDNITTPQQLEKNLDTYVSKTGAESFFTEFYKDIASVSEYTPEAIQKDYDNYNYKRKHGLTIHLLYKLAINEINKNYKDIITKCIHQSVDLKQVYLNVNSKNTLITFESYSSKLHPWKFEVGGSTKNPTLKALSLRMT